MKLELEQVSYVHPDGTSALRAATVTAPPGAVTVVIGPSGSGKSTLLRIVAGLLTPRAGAVRFDGRDVSHEPAERRNVGLVFQSYALFPHLTVAENIGFGLTTRRRRLPPSETTTRTAEAAELLGITHLLSRRPATLSGGEQQRVAVARAVALRPPLLLLDEPLSALDAQLRREIRGEMARLLSRLGTTVVYVTHDQEEAMLLADHLVVLRAGEVEQAGEPVTLYDRPANAFVAAFLGEATLLPAVVGADGIARADAAPELATPAKSAPECRGQLALRPEDLALVDSGGTPVSVVTARRVGPTVRLVARLAGGHELVVQLPAGPVPVSGQPLSLVVRQGRGTFLVA